MKVMVKTAERICLLIVSMGMASAAHAGFSSAQGGSGLLMMRTPDVMPAGDVDSTFFIQYDTYKDPVTGLKRSDFRLTPSLSRALTERFEAGLSMPYLSSPALNANGMQSLNGFFNWRFAGQRRGIASSLSGDAAVLSSNALNGVGSGDDRFSGAVNIGYIGTNASIYLSLGRGQVDRPMFTFTPAVSRSWARLYETTSALGVQYRTQSDRVALSLEVKSSQNNNAEKTVSVAPGIRIRQGDNVVWTLGAAVDASSTDYTFQPSNQVFAAVSLNTNVEAQRRRAGIVQEVPEPAPMPTPVATPSKQATVITPPRPVTPPVRVMPVTRTVADVPLRLPGVVAGASTASGCYNAANYRSKCGVQIEVVNRSGRYSAAEAVAQRLREAGYNVVRVINQADGERSEASWVRYRPGMAGEAVKVGHTIPRNQIVRKSHTLPNDVAVRVVVGVDLR